jgi:hypothetical protein
LLIVEWVADAAGCPALAHVGDQPLRGRAGEIFQSALIRFCGSCAVAH